MKRSNQWPDRADHEEWRHLYEERAAIMEHHGGLTREEAEAAARAEMLEAWASCSDLVIY